MKNKSFHELPKPPLEILPKTFKNYKGEDVAAKYPRKGELISSIEDHIFLFKSGKYSYSVVYGLQIEEKLGLEQAFRRMGECFAHSKGEEFECWL